jgi:hypothetical protein
MVINHFDMQGRSAVHLLSKSYDEMSLAAMRTQNLSAAHTCCLIAHKIYQQHIPVALLHLPFWHCGTLRVQSIDG